MTTEKSHLTNTAVPGNLGHPVTVAKRLLVICLPPTPLNLPHSRLLHPSHTSHTRALP